MFLVVGHLAQGVLPDVGANTSDVGIVHVHLDQPVQGLAQAGVAGGSAPAASMANAARPVLPPVHHSLPDRAVGLLARAQVRHRIVNGGADLGGRDRSTKGS